MPGEMTYTIKPLEWERVYDDRVSACTPFGSYWAEPRGWGYCFDEYYDEDDLSCDSLEEGKAAAEADWLKRITGALTPIKPRRGRKS